MVESVLWDMDGVLIDSEPGYNVSVAEMFHSLGYPFGAREIKKMTGASFKNIADILELPIPNETIQNLYTEALMKSVRKDVTRLIEGIPETLDALKSHGIKLAIGSSSPRELVCFVAEKFGLRQWFDVYVTGSDAENGKPAPDIYRKCAELLGTAPNRCLVVEDSVNGILAGKNAGMRVCAFTGTRRHDFDLSGSDVEISAFSPDEFIAMLDRF